MNKIYLKEIQIHNLLLKMRSRIGRKGGIKSGQVKRQRKAMKEQMEMLLSLPVKSKDMKEQLKQFGIDEDNIDNQMLLLVGLFEASLKGNVQAFNSIQELVEKKQDENKDTMNKLDEVLKNIGGVV